MQVELTLHEKACLDYAIAQAATQLQSSLLDTCADQEYRICLLELGINGSPDKEETL